MKNIDWKSLSFAYQKTNYNVRCTYKDGAWSEPEASTSEYLDVHIAATALHYGQEAFEGMKAFRDKEGRIRLFRWEDNCRRLQTSAAGILMAPVPDQLFKEAIYKVVKLNAEFVPPHGTGASLYIRPLLFGSGPKVGVSPADEYTFIVFVIPVGPYFKEGFKPVNMQLVDDYDRAAPQGTGSLKVGGNYAASLRAGVRAAKEGFAAPLFLDAKEKKYIDEAGPANFFGIKNNTYITPKSDTILPSITNRSLMQLAEDMGLKVERRPVPVEELETLEEAGACGTAAVISPIGKVYDRRSQKEYVIAKDGKPGPVSEQLFKTLQGIQYGDVEDKHNWITIVE